MPRPAPSQDPHDETPADLARRSRAFGRVADAYDRFRPGYPAALLDDVLALAPAMPPRILEAGAGTGRASLLLAARGARVTAVEPDPEMAAVARRRAGEAGVADRIELVEAAFEASDPAPGAYDLVTAAQAWHWVDPQAGPATARRALRPGGALCVWWNRPGDLEGPVWDAVHAAYATHAPALERRTALHRRPVGEQALAPAEGFGPWTHRHYDWVARYAAADYAALVGTHSDHLLLPEEQRAALADAIRAAIEDAGEGVLEYRYRTLLLSASPTG
jgi:SAM-dependent methyltransferase